MLGPQTMNLEKVLDKLFDNLRENGLLPQSANKAELVNEVITHLREANNGLLPALDLKNENTFKALGVALMATFAQKNDPHFKFEFVLLFKELNNMSREELNQFKMALTQNIETILLTLNQHSPRPKGPNEIRAVAATLADEMIKNNYYELCKDKRVAAIFSEAVTLKMELDAASLALRSLYGGFDPRVTGGVGVIVTRTAGNVAGFLDFVSGLKNDKTYMGVENDIDNIITNKLSMGAPTAALVANTPRLEL